MNKYRLAYFYFYLLKKSKLKLFLKYKFYKFFNYFEYFYFYNSFHKNGFFKSLKKKEPFFLKPKYLKEKNYKLDRLNDLNLIIKNRLWNILHKKQKKRLIINKMLESNAKFPYQKLMYLLYNYLTIKERKSFSKSFNALMKKNINIPFFLSKKKRGKTNNLFSSFFKFNKKKKKKDQFYEFKLHRFKRAYKNSKQFQIDKKKKKKKKLIQLIKSNRLTIFFKYYYKFYISYKYKINFDFDQYQFKQRKKFWMILFKKYNISILNSLASIYVLNKKRNMFNYLKFSNKIENLTKYMPSFLIKLKSSIKNLPVKKKNLYKYIQFFFLHFFRNKINSTLFNYKVQTQFETYKNYPKNKYYKRAFLRTNFLRRLLFKRKILNYIVTKHVIFIHFFRKLILFYKKINYRKNANLFYKFNLLLKYIIKKYYSTLNSSNKVILHLLNLRYKQKRFLKMKFKKVKNYHYIFCSFMKRILKSFLFKHIHFKFYKRNFFITVSNYKGNVKKKYSIGLIGYKKDKKKTYYAAQELIRRVTPSILRFKRFYDFQLKVGKHLFKSKYFNFYWNLIRQHFGILKGKRKNLRGKYLINLDIYYRHSFLNNLMYRISKQVIVKLILKGMKHRMKGILNMFFKELYKYKKSKSFHVPKVLFFPLNSKPHNGCRYPKKKRKKRRRRARKLKLRIKNKQLRKKLKKKKRLFYKRFNVKVKRALLFVKRKLNSKTYYKRTKKRYRLRPYKRINFMPNFKNYKYITKENRFFYKKRRKKFSRYKFKNKYNLFSS